LVKGRARARRREGFDDGRKRSGVERERW